VGEGRIEKVSRWQVEEGHGEGKGGLKRLRLEKSGMVRRLVMRVRWGRVEAAGIGGSNGEERLGRSGVGKRKV
jgi:hypothetical protein